MARQLVASKHHVRTRFAPSPTGPLHLGHAYSAILAYDFAKAQGGEFLLRIEDLDKSRARASWEDQIYDDLSWLGLTWQADIMRQSDRTATYGAALDQLWQENAIYACHCSRRDIQTAASAPQEGAEPQFGPDGILYPKTCHGLERPQRRPNDCSLRLDMARAVQNARSFSYVETGPLGQGTHKQIFTPQTAIDTLGDIVVARRDLAAAYHLAVVIDDAEQGITHAVRGADLEEATKIHVVLQHVLNLPTPNYLHHTLIRDDAGKRLAKRDDAKSIATFRAQGASPDDIRRLVGL